MFGAAIKRGVRRQYFPLQSPQAISVFRAGPRVSGLRDGVGYL
jgi:hypothetical protein